MFGLGISEFLVVLVLVLLVGVLAVIIVLAARVGAHPSARLAWRTPGLMPPIPFDLQDRIRELCADGKKIHAIKIVREETGLGLKEAKDVVDALEAGRPVPGTHAAMRTSEHADLASRVRELKAAGRTEQAVFLVRGETGMGQDEAETFVDAV